MDWNKIAPWNWFKDEEGTPARTQPAPSPLQSSGDSFATLRTEIERVLDDTVGLRFPGLNLRPAASIRPVVDVSEAKKAYAVRAELPGIEADDISIEVEGQRLVIRGERHRDEEKDIEGYHYIESSCGVIRRVLSLPDDADGESIEARFKNGVLDLRIPKHAARASNTKTIEIQSG